MRNTIIDILIEFASTQKNEEDPDFILHLADSVFNFDIVNEEAMGNTALPQIPIQNSVKITKFSIISITRNHLPKQLNKG